MNAKTIRGIGVRFDHNHNFVVLNATTYHLSDGRWFCDGDPVSLYAQGSGADSTDYYAARVTIEGYLDLETARKAIKILGPIEAKLVKLYEQRGHATTIGEWVVRVAEVLGASVLRWSDAQDSWEPMRASDARGWVDRRWTERTLQRVA